MAGTCHEQVCIVVHLVLSVLAALVVQYAASCVCAVVLGAHLVLLMLAALGICVGYVCVVVLERIWCCLCVGYMYVL